MTTCCPKSLRADTSRTKRQMRPFTCLLYSAAIESMIFSVNCWASLVNGKCSMKRMSSFIGISRIFRPYTHHECIFFTFFMLLPRLIVCLLLLLLAVKIPFLDSPLCHFASNKKFFTLLKKNPANKFFILQFYGMKCVVRRSNYEAEKKILY